MKQFRGTTIVSVRRNGKVAIAGDGQVSMGNTVMKGNARKVRELAKGRVIAVASIAGVRGLKGAPAYTASKHGLIGLIRGLSEDLIGTGITCNALCPGYVATEIIDRNVAAIQARAGVTGDEALALMVNANRHKRLIDPAEVAAAALWLCADGSDSVNGQTIEIAGGQV